MIRRVLLLAGLAGAMALAGWLYARGWRPDPARFPLQGIDVSHHNGAIDWAVVHAEGADFAYIKATEGATLRDPRFAENWRAARAAGIRRGAYHFFTLCRGGAEQAHNFIATVPRDAAALPPAIDLEFGGNCAARPGRDALIAELRAFLTRIETHSGKPALLYVTGEFEDAYGITRAVERPLWARRLFAEPAYGARPWVMWQASNMRRVAGIAGPVDWHVGRP